MTKVQITYFGKQALVDADQVVLLTKKESLVKAALDIQHAHPNVAPMNAAAELDVVMRKIRSLNRKIRQNVQFLQS